MGTTDCHGPHCFGFQLLVLNDVHKSLLISLNPTLHCPILSEGTYPRQSLYIGSLLRLRPLLLLNFDRALHSIALELLDEFVLDLAGLKLLQALLQHLRVLEHVLHDLLHCGLLLVLDYCLLPHEVLAHRVQVKEVTHFLLFISQVEVVMQYWRVRC